MIVVYGASDDLVEVEGDISEEFSCYGEPRYLAFSDGSVLLIEYGRSGTWHIRPVVRGAAPLDIATAPVDDEDDYSDRATLQGALEWVVCGSEFVKRVGTDR